MVERLTDLDSSQEEADTRLLLHAALACVASVSVLFGSEERDFRRFARAKIGARAKKQGGGWETFPSFPSPTPLLAFFALAPIFARAKRRKSRSSLLKSTETLATQANAAHAARSQLVAVIIVSEDTDILVLSLAFKSFIPSSMFIKCSSQTRVKYLDVSRMIERIGASTCKALPGFHAFTGCDTVSAFQGREKVLVFRIMAKDQGFQEVFQGLGREWQVSNELYRDLQRFACPMYCRNAGTNEVNELRYWLFCLKKGNVYSNQLPPCDDSLRKHALRANYQAAI